MSSTDLAAPAVQVRKAQAVELPVIGQALAAAFHDDPVIGWVVPDPGVRRALLPGFFELMASVSQEHDEVYTTDDLDGAALWMPPEALVTDEAEAEAFAAAVARVTAGCGDRMLRLLAILDERHPHEPHYYLPVVGARPGRQGRGIGTALLRPALRRCDAVGAPAYLEATAPGNVHLYERLGFEVTGRIVLPHGPTVTPMWRSPSSPTA